MTKLFKFTIQNDRSSKGIYITLFWIINILFMVNYVKGVHITLGVGLLSKYEISVTLTTYGTN